MQKRIRPTKCRMWHMHDRLEEQIDIKACVALIESIRKHGQKHPVLGRPISNEEGYEVELVYGARRLHAARHLGVDLLVEVRDIDDRSALVEMDIENRLRQDISPYERGRAYRLWLSAGFFKTQAELAKEIRISEAQVSRLLRYADLPAAIVAAFGSPADIREDWAVNLANCCRDHIVRNLLVRRARDRASSSRRNTPQAIYDTLINNTQKRIIKCQPRHEVIKNSAGTPLFRIAFQARGIHLIFSRENVSQATLQIIAEQLKQILESSSTQRNLSQSRVMSSLHTNSSQPGPDPISDRTNGQSDRPA